MARNRVIYQSQALYVSPSATGAQVSGTAADGTINGAAVISPTAGDTGTLASGISLLKKLDRVQTCNFNFTINRQDINEFGKLARLDTIVMETPTVGLDFSYYVTDGKNERLLGFNVTGASDTTVPDAQSISGMLTDTQGNNFYILTVDEGSDVVGTDTITSTSTVVGIGNGFITDYSFEASVGAIPTATVTVEAFNIKSDTNGYFVEPNAATGYSGYSPAVDLFSSPAAKLTSVADAYKIDLRNDKTPQTAITTGVSTVAALRPGDLVLTLPQSSGIADISGEGSAHIQSFSFSIPLTRTILQRLGNTFGFSRVVDVPINMDISLSAIVSELRSTNMFDLLGSPTQQTFVVLLNDPNGNGRMAYEIRGAILQTETYSENIGDNQTVDLTYTVQLGGANDLTAGVFMSGSYDPSDEVLNKGFKLGSSKNTE